jgi:hypothetical protein
MKGENIMSRKTFGILLAIGLAIFLIAPVATAQQQQAQAQQQSQAQQATAQQDSKQQDYLRARGACLEGKGYSVK